MVTNVNAITVTMLRVEWDGLINVVYVHIFVF